MQEQRQCNKERNGQISYSHEMTLLPCPWHVVVVFAAPSDVDDDRTVF